MAALKTTRLDEYPGARTMKIVLLVCSVAMLCLFGLGAWEENFGGQWRALQHGYRNLLVSAAKSPGARHSAASFHVELRQLYLPELHTVDRCVSCHLGLQVPSMADAPQPFREHSGDLLVHHPPELFGCTVCHDGQGRAATESDAHGWTREGSPVPYAQSRLLRGDEIFTSCGRCHTEVDLYGGQADFYAGSGEDATEGPQREEIDRAALSASLPGAEVLGEGKRLVVESGCLGCHRYQGVGGDLGPDLTYEGDKIAHDFDFSAVTGEHTVERWHVEHFMHPSRVAPGSVMPDMGYTQEQAWALAMYMMSLHRKVAPVSRVPRPTVTASTESGPVSGKTLYGMFCSACHGLTGGGDGPAATTIPDRPRDFRDEPFRYVSTTDGGPTQEDLIRTISTGRGIEEMSKDPHFTDDEVQALVEYVRSLARSGLEEKLTKAFANDPDTTKEDIEEIAVERTKPGEPLQVTEPGPRFEVDLDRAKQLFSENCASCHGPGGRGDGTQDLVDELGRPMHARDLTKGMFFGGDRPDDLFKRIRLGIPGTPMPAQNTLSDEEVWQLVHYVFHLAHRETP